ncbi:MAG: thioredoxin family protein, partial [Proteobacteria bacterium]|nr:thioredoxin family protein [Pseudomonadota bacterium]
FLGCTHQICLMPYTQELKVPIYAADDSTDLKASATPGELKEIKHEPTPPSFEAPSSQNLSFEEKYAEQLKSGQLPWSIILLIIFIGGIATNLTPCVFPMIPITLRLLAQQGHARFTSTLFYALGIIVTYTGLGLIASLGGGIFGSVLASTWFNIVFAGIFILLGITMLGFGNLSKIQELGLQLGAGKSSYLNAFGMGAGAGLVAALLTYATALHSTIQSAGLFLLYSSGFALPYVFLGLAAKRVVSYKVSPKVQVSVKILFAAAMFGLALYYLKNPAHDSLQSLQGHWRELFIVLLGISIPILIYIVRHSHFILKKEVQLLPTLILGLGLFAGIQWASGNDVVAQLRWLSDLEAGYAEAARSHKPILIDGYADWCVACKKMDQTTYVEPEVISLLQDGWVLVKLDFTATTEASDALAQKFDMQGLPTMVMLPSDGDLSKSVKFAGYMTAERLLTELRNFKGK